MQMWKSQYQEHQLPETHNYSSEVLSPIGSVHAQLGRLFLVDGLSTDGGIDRLASLLRTYQVAVTRYGSFPENLDMALYARMGPMASRALGSAGREGLEKIEYSQEWPLLTLWHNAKRLAGAGDTVSGWRVERPLGVDYHTLPYVPVILQETWLDEGEMYHSAYLPLVIYDQIDSPTLASDENAAWVAMGLTMLQQLRSVLTITMDGYAQEMELTDWVGRNRHRPLSTPLAALIYNWEQGQYFDDNTGFGRMQIDCAGDFFAEISGRKWGGWVHDPEGWAKASWGNVSQLMTEAVGKRIMRLGQEADEHEQHLVIQTLAAWYGMREDVGAILGCLG